MDLARIEERLLSRPGATRALHEKWGWMVYWAGGRQFACEFEASPDAKPPYAGRHLLSLKCDPDRIRELREERPDAVLSGYYSDGRTWISIDLGSDLPEGLVLELCDLSYDLVFSRLTKRAQREILAESAAAAKGVEDMDKREAFEALKRHAIEENERAYGREARERYGDDAVDAANERLASLSRDEWGEKDQLEQAIKEQLRAAMATGDPAGDAARELAQMHERWIRLHWGEGRYSREAHRGLAQMYLADDRFRAYYDTAAGEGATEFLVAALESYLA